MTSPGTPEGALALIWPGVDQLDTLRCNQILAQIQNDSRGRQLDVILTLGHVSPPVLLGTPEEQMATLGALRAVSVKPFAKVAVDRQSLEEFIGVLQATLQRFDEERGTGR